MLPKAPSNPFTASVAASSWPFLPLLSPTAEEPIDHPCRSLRRIASGWQKAFRVHGGEGRAIRNEARLG